MASLTNVVGYMLCLVAFALLGLVRGNDPWRISTLVVGVMMVVFGTFALGMFGDLVVFFDTAHELRGMDETAREQGKAATQLWMFAFPAVVLAIGANLLTAWILSKKPN